MGLLADMIAIANSLWRRGGVEAAWGDRGGWNRTRGCNFRNANPPLPRVVCRQWDQTGGGGARPLSGSVPPTVTHKVRGKTAGLSFAIAIVSGCQWG